MESQNISKFRKGLLLARGSWRTLRLDKELIALPYLGMAISTAFVALVVLIVARAGGLHLVLNQPTEGNVSIKPLGYLIGAFVILISNMLNTILRGAIMHGALERFRGNNPTLKSSLKGALRKWKPLVAFSAFATVIGWLIQQVANRLPFGGKIVAFFADCAFGVATVFAIPAILDTKEDLNPLQATKKSVGIIKKVWGESLIANLSIATVIAIGVIAGIVANGLIIAGLSVTFGGVAVQVGAVISAILTFGIILLAIGSSVLEAIVKAAVYHYAVTGESPVSFDKDLMKQAFTHKKARRLFAR